MVLFIFAQKLSLEEAWFQSSIPFNLLQLHLQTVIFNQGLPCNPHTKPCSFQKSLKTPHGPCYQSWIGCCFNQQVNITCMAQDRSHAVHQYGVHLWTKFPNRRWLLARSQWPFLSWFQWHNPRSAVWWVLDYNTWMWLSYSTVQVSSSNQSLFMFCNTKLIVDANSIKGMMDCW